MIGTLPLRCKWLFFFFVVVETVETDVGHDTAPPLIVKDGIGGRFLKQPYVQSKIMHPEAKLRRSACPAVHCAILDNDLHKVVHIGYIGHRTENQTTTIGCQDMDARQGFGYIIKFSLV